MKEIMTVDRMERSGQAHTHVELAADVAQGPLRLEVRVITANIATCGFTIGARYVVTIEKQTDLESLR